MYILWLLFVFLVRVKISEHFSNKHLVKSSVVLISQENFHLVSFIWRASLKPIPISILNAAFLVVFTQKALSIREENPLELIFTSVLSFSIIKWDFESAACEHQSVGGPNPRASAKVTSVSEGQPTYCRTQLNFCSYILWEWEPYWIFKLSTALLFNLFILFICDFCMWIPFVFSGDFVTSVLWQCMSLGGTM